MNEKHDKAELDKLEQQRREREARIRSLRTKDGGKKQIKTRSRWGRIAAPIVIALLLIVGLIWGAFNLGIVHRLAKPMKVGQESIGMVEYNYHYASYLNTYSQYAQYGIVPTNALGRLDLDADTGMSGYEETSWGDYLHVLTQQSVQQVVAFADQAKEEGIELSEEANESIDSFFSGLKAQYPTELEQSNFLEASYGRGATEASLRPVLERTMLANEYVARHPESYDISEDDIQKQYEENKDTYDVVEYRLLAITVPAAEKGATDEDKEKLKKETEEKAEEMLERITDFDSFKELAVEYVPAEDKPDYKNGDPTYFSNMRSSRVTNADLNKWLFDAKREAGDKEVINVSTTYYVIYFNERSRSEELMPAVRHILFEAREDEATDKEMEEAEAAAKETLDKIKNEDDMIRLSEELVESKEAVEARLYENVARGTMVKEFEDWIYDSEREEGDTGIVKTVYGFHVMYYAGKSEHPAWYLEAEKALRDEAFAEESEEIVEQEDYSVEVNRLAVRLAGS